MPTIEPDGIGAQEPAHAIDQIGLGGLNHLMEMIAHETIGMHLPSGLLTSFSHGFQEFLTIDIIQVNIFPAITATQDVVNRSRILDPHLPRHTEG